MENIHENIILAFSLGDKRAFGVLFLTYHPKLLNFIEGFVKDHETARDLAQDLFISLWRDRKKCAQVRNFQSYLSKWRAMLFTITSTIVSSMINM